MKLPGHSPRIADKEEIQRQLDERCYLNHDVGGWGGQPLKQAKPGPTWFQEELPYLAL